MSYFTGLEHPPINQGTSGCPNYLLPTILSFAQNLGLGATSAAFRASFQPIN